MRTHIRDLLVHRFAQSLETECKTNAYRTDPARVDLVKPYRFQQEPQGTPVYLSVIAGDVSDPTLRDARVKADEQESLGINLPSGEIGGGHLWWRRGRVTIACYYVMHKFSQEDAALHSHTVLGRVTHHLERTQVADLVDDFGERALATMVIANVFFESGGPPDQYIWRGEVEWQVLTERPM